MCAIGLDERGALDFPVELHPISSSQSYSIDALVFYAQCICVENGYVLPDIHAWNCQWHTINRTVNKTELEVKYHGTPVPDFNFLTYIGGCEHHFQSFGSSFIRYANLDEDCFPTLQNLHDFPSWYIVHICPL